MPYVKTNQEKLKVIRDCRDSGLTIPAYAEHVGMANRTIYTYINDLTKAGLLSEMDLPASYKPMPRKNNSVKQMFQNLKKPVPVDPGFEQTSFKSLDDSEVITEEEPRFKTTIEVEGPVDISVRGNKTIIRW